jgi:hypothetical protein
VELKAVEELIPVHEAQLLTYLRLSGRWLGLESICEDQAAFLVFFSYLNGGFWWL